MPQPESASHEILLDVRNLTIHADVDDRELVHEVNLTVRRGHTLGIVGESGSGKSITLRAILGLLPKSLAVTGGTIELFGKDVADFRETDWNDVRGNGITAVFQDPGSYLNPSITIGKQVSEVLRVRRGLSRRDAKAETLALLDEVRIDSPALVASQYPHELSGGMLQRIMLAIAISLRPRILIADEATTALDVTVQAEVLDLIVDLTEQYGLSLVIVSHDLAVVAQVADEVLVFRDGRIVDRGPTSEVLHRPAHEYSRLLVDEHERYGIDKYLSETPHAS